MRCHDLCGSRLESSRPSFVDDIAQPRIANVARIPQLGKRVSRSPMDGGAIELYERRPYHRTAEVSYGSPGDLDQLEVDDSDPEDGQCRARTACGALGVVRSILAGRVSPRVNTRRHSQASIGNSHEEIARRAELKRLMHKRIQNELETDDKPNAAGGKRTGSSRGMSLFDLAQPGPGPRDNIEFAFDSPNLPMSLSELGSGHQTSLPTSGIMGKDCHGRHLSLSSDDCPQDADRGADLGPKALKCTCIPAVRNQFIASSPLSRVTEVTCCSSLAQTSDTRRDSDSRQCKRSQSLDGQSALGVWLASQHMEHSESSTDIEPDSHEARFTSKSCPVSDDTGTADEKTTAIVSTKVSGPVKKSGSQAESLSGIAIQQSAKSTGALGSRLISNLRRGTSSETSDDVFFTPSDFGEDYRLAMAYTSPVDNSSSSYPSAMPSFQPSPVRSRSHLPRLSIQDLKDLSLSPFQFRENAITLQNLESAEDMTLTTDKSENPGYWEARLSHNETVQQQTASVVDGVSLPDSETTTFREREAELLTIEHRFKDILARKKPLPPIDSRFKEEFDAPQARGSLRSALMTRVLLSAPRHSSRPSSQSNEAILSPLLPPLQQAILHDTSRSRLTEIGNKSPDMPMSSQVMPGQSSKIQPTINSERPINLWQRAIGLDFMPFSKGTSSHKMSVFRKRKHRAHQKATSFPIHRGVHDSHLDSLSTHKPRSERSQSVPYGQGIANLGCLTENFASLQEPEIQPMHERSSKTKDVVIFPIQRPKNASNTLPMAMSADMMLNKTSPQPTVGLPYSATGQFLGINSSNVPQGPVSLGSGYSFPVARLPHRESSALFATKAAVDKPRGTLEHTVSNNWDGTKLPQQLSKQ